MGRTIVVTSGKGGVGKTTVVAGLAKALACLNASVCVVDADIGLNNLDLVLNVENKVVYDIVDCMQGKCRIKQALIKDIILDNLFIMPSGKNLPINMVITFKEIISKLASIFDFVLIDCPAGVDKGFKRAVECASESIIVVTPHISSVRDAAKTINLLNSNDGKIQNYLIVNRVRGDLVAGKQMMSHLDIETLLNIKSIGVVPECDEYNVSNSFMYVKDVKNNFNLAFKIIAKNLINNTFEQLDYIKKYKGVLGYFKRKLKNL